jgi:zinc transport system ATP-binding protein
MNEKAELIRLEGVSVYYGLRKVFSDVSFTIHEGEYVGIIGKNGSGKSTLLKAILGLEPIKTGRIVYLNNPTLQKIPYDQIGYTAQMHPIQRDFPATVGDIVEMGLYLQNGLFKRRDPKNVEKVMYALHQVGMERFVNRPIGHLSGGEQQKVMIAQALVKKPKILILDEPTSAFDFITLNNFTKLLDDLNHRLGIAILVVQHNLEVLRPYCSRLIMLRNRILFDGNPKDPKIDSLLPDVFAYSLEPSI